jgi:hypothetical protein
MMNGVDPIDDVAVGNSAFFQATLGTSNVALGDYSLYCLTTGSNNVAVGAYAGYSLTNQAMWNTYIGFGAGSNTASHAMTGSNNIGLGYAAASTFTGNESSNIDIGNPGVAGDQNVTRIGSSQTTTYISGLLNNTNGAAGYCTSNNYSTFSSTGMTNKAAYSQCFWITVSTGLSTGNLVHFNSAGQMDGSNQFAILRTNDLYIPIQPNGGFSNSSTLTITSNGCWASGL